MAKTARAKWILALAASLAFAIGVSAQTEKLDLNSYYRYPLSVGAEYQSITPFGDYKSNFDLYDISAHIRYPIPKLPSLQPSFQGGLLQFSSRDLAKKWEHKDIYGLLGASYSNRISKTFELSRGALGGRFAISLRESGPR